MLRRLLSLLLPFALAVSACAPSAEKAEGTYETTTTASTTTTTLPTTTTTAPLEVEGAPDELNEVVEGFYDYALGVATTPPPARPGIVASITPAEGVKPTHGTASTASFGGQAIATIVVGDDIFLAVDAGAGWEIVGGEWPGIGVPAYYGEGPRLVAVVGSDARPNEDMDETRNDSIHFVGLDGAGGGVVVGLPRDSYVPVPGFGTRKITGALALGGPDVMFEAFLDLTELPLEGYVLTGFAGFQSLVDEVLGGVEVEVPFAINDEKAKAALSAGLQVLNGFDALAFARARKTVPGGDFTRSEHQGDILIGAAKGVRALGPQAIPGLMEAAEPYLLTSLTPEQLLTFSTMAISADLDAMPSVVAPGSPGTAGSASVVYLHDAAYEMFADLADGNLDG